MDILSLTTTEAIRAVLGVSEEADELPDQVFDDLEIEDAIELEFASWLTTDITTILESGSSLSQKALRACAKYTGALLLLPSLVNATASQLSDGQNAFHRQPRDFKALQESLTGSLERYKDILQETLEVTVSVTPTFFGIATPAFDPVTG